MKIKIEHTVDNNIIEVVVSMKLKKYKSDKTVSYGYDQLVEYCSRNNLPIGTLVSSTCLECANDREANATGRWIFRISKEYKKSLTSSNKTVNVKKVKKSKPARSRAAALASSTRRKTRSNMENNREERNDDDKNEPAKSTTEG